MREAHDFGRVREVRRAGRPVQQHRQLAREVQADERDVPGHGGRHHQPDVRSRDVPEAAAHGPRPDDELLVSHAAGHVVRDDHVAELLEGAIQDRRGNRVAFDHEWAHIGGRREPARRRRLRRCLLAQPFGQRPELTDRRGNRLAREAEPLLHLKRDFHRVEAIEPELREGLVARVLVLRERPLELLLDEMRHGLLRLRFYLREIEFNLRRPRRELEGARAEQEVVRHVRRLLGFARRQVRVEPVLEPPIDGIARRLRAVLRNERFELNLNLATRGEHEQIRDPDQERPNDDLADVQLPVRGRGVARHAAPEAAGAGEYDRDFRHGGEYVGHGSRAAKVFSTIAREPATRPDNDVLAGLQRLHDRACGGLRTLAHLGTRLVGVGHADAAEQPGERREYGIVEVRFEEERPHLEREPEPREHVRRVRVGGVVRQNQIRPRLRKHLGQAVEGHAIAE